MSLALSLCQYVLRPRRGLAEPRSASIACFGNATSCINIIERRYKRLVLGFVFGTWNWYDFWRRSWGLPCSRPSLPTRCWFVWGWCVSILEQRSWRRCMGGLKTGPSRRHRIQPAEGPVLDPRAKETCFKKGQKVDPLEIKSGPSWRAFFFFCCGRYRSEARS